MEGDKREMRKRGETSRSTERKVEESKEKEEGNKKDQFQQFIEMMQRDKQERTEKEAKDMQERDKKEAKQKQERDKKEAKEKQERADKEAKEKQEKEQRRKQKDEEKQCDKQERDEEKQREKQEKEERRRQKEQEKLREKREIMQRFERLEKRIIEREENISKKIESMVRKNIKEMKEELEDKEEEDDLFKKKVQNEIQETNESQKEEQQLEDDQLKGKVDNKIEELHNELIKQQEQEQQQEEIPQRPEANETNQIIEYVYTGKIEATTQLQIIYGDVKFNPCKQINDIQRHLQGIERVNREAYEDEIRPNIPDVCKRKAEIWDRVRMKIEKALLNKFWGSEECKIHYPLLEGKINKSVTISYLGSNIGNISTKNKESVIDIDYINLLDDQQIKVLTNYKYKRKQ